MSWLSVLRRPKAISSYRPPTLCVEADAAQEHSTATSASRANLFSLSAP